MIAERLGRLAMVLCAGTILAIGARPAAAVCVGDCDGVDGVRINEVQHVINIFLGAATVDGCTAADRDGDGMVKIDEVQAAVNSFLSDPISCPKVNAATPTVTATSTSSLSPSPTATPTPSPTIPPTASPTMQSVSPTATKTHAPAVCGNGAIEAGETCDDGNTITNPPTDKCPADCTIITCTTVAQTRTVMVNLAAPANADVESMTVILEYPDGIVQIPGSGDDDSVAAAVTNTPSGFLTPVFDYNYALSIGLAGSKALAPGPLFTVTFSSCSGASAPSAAAFKCTVHDAANGNFEPVAGVTCSVTVS